MIRNILVCSDKNYEQLTINLLQSFERLPDEYNFYYYTFGFDSDYEHKNLKKFRIEAIQDIPTVTLYKPLAFQDILNHVDHFIYFDCDIIVSKNFDYYKLINQIDQYPKGATINGWDDPFFWYIDDNHNKIILNFEKLMEYQNVKLKTQKWSSSCVLIANKNCKSFIDEWVEVCMDKKLWCINEPFFYKNEIIEIPTWKQYLVAGEESVYNVLLWKYRLKDCFFENLILEPKKFETIIKIETSKISNEQLEPNNIASYCYNSDSVIGYHQLKNLDFREKVLSYLKMNESKTIFTGKQYRFGIYTSFYNAKNFIDKIFDSVSKINYTNFKWIITDDFSEDNTKNLLLEKIKFYDFVEYVEQKHKKEMYWKPNKFFDASYDYIVLLDCDDDFDFNFLNIYNKFVNLYDDAVIITSDLIKKEENSFHSLSLVKNDELLIDKLNNFHPQVDYLNNISYNCIGHLRCFKNITSLDFKIDDFHACAEDSYRMMYMNSLGKWLHIPRTMYQWNIRKDSESHSVVKSNFNGNFDCAYKKLSYNNFEPYSVYNDIYKETCAFSILGINELTNKTVSIFTKNLSLDQKNKLRFIYGDCKIQFDSFEYSDIYIINAEYYFDSNFITNAVNKIKNNYPLSKIVVYYQEDSHFDNKENMQNVISQKFDKLKSKISFLPYNYYLYFRHNYIVI